MRAAVLDRPGARFGRRAAGRTASGSAALGLVVLLAALGLVAWRQVRALEALALLERTRQERALAVAERSELNRRIQYLESRGHAVPEARKRLGMHTPEASDIVILPGVRR